MASQSVTQGPCGGSLSANPSCSPEAKAGACPPPGPCLPGDLQATSGGTRVNARLVGTYSQDATASKECARIPLKSGGALIISWNRVSGQDAVYFSYADKWIVTLREVLPKTR